jgi:phosphoribosylanthranilate isomerase
MAKKDLFEIVSKLKICGVTNYSDIEACVRFCVDYIGFNVFEGSKRYLKPSDVVSLWNEACTKHSQNLPTPVIVSVNSDLGRLIQLHSDLDGKAIFQLHGAEGREYVTELVARAPQIKIWQALAVSDDELPVTGKIHPSTTLVLYDAARKGSSGFGGSGSTFDWSILPKIHKPGIWGLAGGINIHNIKNALQFKPWLIDVSSGSESKPGVKDHDKIKILRDLTKGI